MNNTIVTQLKHKSIREFTKEAIPEDVLEILQQVAIRTPTSSGLQSSSIIRVSDDNLKREISEICNQEYVARLPEFWLFIVDTYRNSKIVEESKQKEEGSKSLRTFFQAYIDAVLMAQNVQVAAESLGLGSVYFGSIYNDISRLINLFKLPPLTFPVLGLGLGYPNQKPQEKPRMDKSLRIFENEYHTFENYLNEIEDYNKEMTTYYDLRQSNKRSDSFVEAISKHLSNVKNIDIIDSIKKQGFTE